MLSLLHKIIIKSTCFDVYLELLNQKTEDIERMMNEKKALVADVLQIPPDDYDTVTEVRLSAYFYMWIYDTWIKVAYGPECHSASL